MCSSISAKTGSLPRVKQQLFTSSRPTTTAYHYELSAADKAVMTIKCKIKQRVSCQECS